MSTITTIQSTDLITNSRAVINTNFSNLNTDKAEKSANLSDMTVPNTALNNILPSQATFGGKVLGTDGSNTSWVDPSGANKATNVVIGLTRLSCAAVDAAVPIAVGDNDGRLPTSDQKAALAGTGTPSGANKYATADTIAGFESTSNKSTTTTLGTSDTYYPSQKAVKTYVDGKLAYVVGGVALVSADTERSNSSVPYIKVKEIANGFLTGTLRIKFDLHISSTGANAYGRIYRNGVAVGIEQSEGTASYVTKSEDIAGWSAGDLIQLYYHCDGNKSAYVRNFRIYSATPVTPVVVTD